MNSRDNRGDDKLIDAYINQRSTDLPDLWSRIETGLDKIDAERNGQGHINVSEKSETDWVRRKKQKNNKVFKIISIASGLAAVAAIAGIVLLSPVFNSAVTKNSKTAESEANDTVDYMADERAIAAAEDDDRDMDSQLMYESKAEGAESNSISKEAENTEEQEAESFVSGNQQPPDGALQTEIDVTLYIQSDSSEPFLSSSEKNEYIITAMIENISVNNLGLSKGDVIKVVMQDDECEGRVSGSIVGRYDNSGAWIFIKK